jgi:hypothetical protein
MLSLFEQHMLRELADDYIRQVLDAIKNKQIDRVSIRYNRSTGDYDRKSFKAAVNASGKLYDSVQSRFGDNGFVVRCEPYIDKLIFGEAPGQPVNTTDIQQWMDDKELPPLGYATPGSILISNKINKFGSSIFIAHQGADSGLLSDVNIEASMNNVMNALKDHYANQVTAAFKESFKQAA